MTPQQPMLVINGNQAYFIDEYNEQTEFHQNEQSYETPKEDRIVENK
jgi:hypothetical protein